MSRTRTASTTNDESKFEAPRDSAGTVTIGCRLPAGLRIERVPGYGTIMFKGCNDDRALQLFDEYGGHGITSGVPADAWAWIQDNYAKAKWLTSGAVFAATKVKDATKEARERGDHNVGFNGLDPEALPNKIEDAAREEAKRN